MFIRTFISLSPTLPINQFVRLVTHGIGKNRVFSNLVARDKKVIVNRGKLIERIISQIDRNI